MTGDILLFYVFGAIAVVASLLVVGQRSPIYSVLLLVGSFAALAGLYVLLDAPFLAVIQIIIYAGAIMVLFLFVVMLLNAPYEDTARLAGDEAARSGQAGGVGGAALPGRSDATDTGIAKVGTRLPAEALPGKQARAGVPWRIGIVLGVALGVELLWSLWRSSALRMQSALVDSQGGAATSSVRRIGQVLYTDYGFAFEVTSILILVAMVGAVVLAKREI